jgi:micrococcal nuclease
MYEYKILEVVKVYDGDTITVILDLGFGISKKEVIRLYGINTPELRGVERPQGLVSRARLLELINNAKNLRIKTHKDKKGKYGRMLGEIFADDYSTSLNHLLISEGLAEEYYGGKK